MQKHPAPGDPPLRSSRAQLLGAEAEDAALAHLQRAGLTLLERNARFRVGEIDLVLLDGATLVFVEVRRRSHAGFGDGADSIDWRKRQRLVRAAAAWRSRHHGQAWRECRFDVVSCAGDPSALRWLPAAFRADDTHG